MQRFVVRFVALSKSKKANSHGTGKFPLHCGGEAEDMFFGCTLFACHTLGVAKKQNSTSTASSHPVAKCVSS
jgi:hypothetical protein